MKINLKQINKDLRQVDETFRPIESLKKITEVSHENVYKWQREEAPAIVELIYWNSKEFNHSFMELINKNANKFPVLRLLKYYEEKTGNKIESVILKSKEDEINTKRQTKSLS